MQNVEVPFADHIDHLAREEIRTYMQANATKYDSYFLVDIETACKLICMKQGMFYKYIRDRPEIRAIERYPVDPETGIASHKRPYFRPDEFKQAIEHIFDSW